jgi:hypothetical protein
MFHFSPVGRGKPRPYGSFLGFRKGEPCDHARQVRVYGQEVFALFCVLLWHLQGWARQATQAREVL